MSLSVSQELVLNEFVANISDSVIWCIFGSTDSVLRGLDDDPSDLDILTTESGAHQIRETFSDAFVGTHEIGISQIDEYQMHGEDLEALFSTRGKDHQEPLVDLDTAECETTADRGVPLLPLDSLVEAYRKIDKHDTVDRLDDEFNLSNRWINAWEYSDILETSTRSRGSYSGSASKSILSTGQRTTCVSSV